MGMTMDEVNKIRYAMEVGDWVDFYVITNYPYSRWQQPSPENICGYITKKFDNIFYINNTSKSFRWIDYAMWRNR